MEEERKERTEILLGKTALEKLKNSCVGVAGLGAVGSYAIEALARAGVGKFIIADFDIIHQSNINRNLFALTSTVSMSKTEVCMKRIKEISPSIEVEIFSEFLDANTIDIFLSKRPDVLIDAIDSLNPKITLLIRACEMNIPVVSSMGAGRRKDPLSVTVNDISETKICPLARKVRERLRKKGITSGIKCIFSTEIPLEPAKDFEELYTPDERKTRPRRPVGTLSTVTGIFGLLVAHTVLKILLPEDL